MLLLALSAAAMDLSEAKWGPSVGLETVTNDPFVYRRGARLGLNVAPTPVVEVGASLSWYPILGQGGESDPDWKPLAKQLLLEASVSPDVSKLWAQGQLTVRVHILRLPLDESWNAGMGLLAGVGAMATRDDLVALQNDGPDAVATQSQVHPVAVGGLFWQVGADVVAIRLRYEADGFVETVNSTTVEVKNNHMLGLEVLCWL